MIEQVLRARCSPWSSYSDPFEHFDRVQCGSEISLRSKLVSDTALTIVWKSVFKERGIRHRTPRWALECVLQGSCGLGSEHAGVQNSPGFATALLLHEADRAARYAGA